jgi:cysteine desulfuration protein SufE
MIENFDDCFDWEDKYRYVLELGRKLPRLTAEQQNDDNRVIGCQSNAWVIAEPEDAAGQLAFKADSDSQIVRGLLSIVVIALSHRSPEEILAYDIEGLFERLELTRHLSPIRGNGLLASVKKVREIAAARAQ